MRKVILWANAIIVIIALNVLIFSKEAVLNNGQEIFLELAPVDPRSLIQGDFMALRYHLATELGALLGSQGSLDGYVIASMGQDHVARSPRQVGPSDMAGPGEVKLLYRKRGRSIKIATDAYFFEEGQMQTYRQARYGILRVDEEGHSVLTGVADQSMNRILNKR